MIKTKEKAGYKLRKGKRKEKTTTVIQKKKKKR